MKKEYNRVIPYLGDIQGIPENHVELNTTTLTFSISLDGITRETKITPEEAELLANIMSRMHETK